MCTGTYPFPRGIGDQMCGTEKPPHKEKSWVPFASVNVFPSPRYREVSPVCFKATECLCHCLPLYNPNLCINRSVCGCWKRCRPCTSIFFSKMFKLPKFTILIISKSTGQWHIANVVQSPPLSMYPFSSSHMETLYLPTSHFPIPSSPSPCWPLLHLPALWVCLV